MSFAQDKREAEVFHFWDAVRRARITLIEARRSKTPAGFAYADLARLELKIAIENADEHGVDVSEFTRPEATA